MIEILWVLMTADFWRHDIQHNDTQHRGIICSIQHKLHNHSLTTHLHHAECLFECHILFIAVLNVIKQSAVMLNVVMLKAVAPILFGLPCLGL